MENIIKINNNIVKTSVTDENLYKHNGVSTEMYTEESDNFPDNKTVENYIAEVIDIIDTFNNLVEYNIEIENCVVKNFRIVTTEDFYWTLCDQLDLLDEKYHCNFYREGALCCGGTL